MIRRSADGAGAGNPGRERLKKAGVVAASSPALGAAGAAIVVGQDWTAFAVAVALFSGFFSLLTAVRPAQAILALMPIQVVTQLAITGPSLAARIGGATVAVAGAVCLVTVRRRPAPLRAAFDTLMTFVNLHPRDQGRVGLFNWWRK